MKSKLVIALASLAVLAGCGTKTKENAPAREVVRGVQLVEVQRSTIPDYVEAVGTVRALQTSQISAETVGTIVSVRAHEGQRVHKGDVLIVVDDAQQRAALERAMASVNAAQQGIAAADADNSLATSTLTRYQSLYDKKSVSPHEMDQVKARAAMAAANSQQAQAALAQARAAEGQARAALGLTRIRAPFDGVITAKLVDAGALAAPGVPLLTVEDMSRFRIEAALDENDVQTAKLGATAPVHIDAFAAEFQGKVVQIVPAADPASRSFVVKLELPVDARLRSGLFGRVRFARGQREAVLLPKSAVLDRGQLQAVYAVSQQNIANLRFVTVGKNFGDQVEVLSGLQGGERVIPQPGDREFSGKHIEGQL
jgi:RND family efflux transporter MFP subunit